LPAPALAVTGEIIMLDNSPEKQGRFSFERFFIFFTVIVSLVHVYYNSFGLIEVVPKNMMHISLMMGIIFLTKRARGSSEVTKPTIPDWVLFALSIGVGVYLLLSYDRWVQSLLNPNTMDRIYGIIFILLVIESARRTVGWVLTSIGVVFLVYTYVGPWCPGAFAHAGFSINRILVRMTMTSEGILGVAAMVSASYIFMFILFASFLRSTKASEFFNDLASAMTGGTRGGPAKASIFASALTGTISGSSQANVATTGSFTIPLMIHTGYKPYFAAAVEAIASTGGVLMPPIMGAAAFIMSSYLGLPYNKIMLAGVTPALLYYWTLFHMVDLGAVRWNLAGMPKDQLPELKQVIKQRGHLLAPLILIIVFLIIGYSPLFAAFVGIISVIVVSFVRKETRLTIPKMIDALSEGAVNGATIAIICAVIGFVIASVGMTGIGQTIGNNIVKWSGSQIWLTGILCMITAIVLGMGLPGPACYIITATVAAPALVKIGIPQLGAHFFAFYFGTMSSVIPPVALTSFTAAAIAGCNPTKVAFTGLFIGSAGFIVPFMWLYNPILLSESFSWGRYAWVVLTAMVGLYSLAHAVIGFGKIKHVFYEKILFGVAALLLVFPHPLTRSIGLAVFAFAFGIHFIRAKKVRAKQK
jgi:TRAP transporter 4TM/12TM fusion protein